MTAVYIYTKDDKPSEKTAKTKNKTAYERSKTMKTNEMINEEMVLTLDNTAAGEEAITAEDLKEISGGWQFFINYNVPCNVCDKWFAGATKGIAEAKLAAHTLSTTHKKNLKLHGYGYYKNKPFWG